MFEGTLSRGGRILSVILVCAFAVGILWMMFRSESASVVITGIGNILAPHNPGRANPTINSTPPRPTRVVTTDVAVEPSGDEFLHTMQVHVYAKEAVGTVIVDEADPSIKHIGLVFSYASFATRSDPLHLEVNGLTDFKLLVLSDGEAKPRLKVSIR